MIRKKKWAALRQRGEVTIFKKACDFTNDLGLL